MNGLRRDGDQGCTVPLYARNPDVVLREAGEEGTLLFNPDTGQVRVINATALFAWRRCDGAHTIGQIAAALADVYECDGRDEVLVDLRVFLAELARAGFVGTVKQS